MRSRLLSLDRSGAFIRLWALAARFKAVGEPPSEDSVGVWAVLAGRGIVGVVERSENAGVLSCEGGSQHEDHWS